MRDSLNHLNLLGARVIPYSSWRPEAERRVWRSASVGGTIDVREAEGEGIKQIGGPIARATDPGEGWSGEPIPVCPCPDATPTCHDSWGVSSMGW